MNYGNAPSETPLKPAVLHILLALSRGPSHGLGIADAAEEISGGEVRLGPGTLYRSLREMDEGGLVEQTASPTADADPRRKYYRMTEAGLEALRAETERLARLVDVARRNLVLPEDA
ncbi:MAG: PadR family transcriptional regulator [Gemmatimonadota bacterium]